MSDRPDRPGGSPDPDILRNQNALIESNLGLARAIAREYRGGRLSDGDLDGEASLALVEAARTYADDARPGVPFSAFAKVLIRSRVRSALHRAPIVRMSRDRERAALRGELEAPRPHDTPIEELGVMPEASDAGDDEAAIADALRFCDDQEREWVGWMLRGATVADACRRMRIPLHRGRSLMRRAQLALAAAFLERGYPMPLMAGMD